MAAAAYEVIINKKMAYNFSFKNKTKTNHSMKE